MNKKGFAVPYSLILGILLIMIILSGSSIIRWINPSFFVDFDILANYWIAFISYWLWVSGVFIMLGLLLNTIYKNRSFLFNVYGYLARIISVN